MQFYIKLHKHIKDHGLELEAGISRVGVAKHLYTSKVENRVMASSKMAFPIIIFYSLALSRGADLGWRLRFKAFSMGWPVASARATGVGIMRMTQSD